MDTDFFDKKKLDKTSQIQQRLKSNKVNVKTF